MKSIYDLLGRFLYLWTFQGYPKSEYIAVFEPLAMNNERRNSSLTSEQLNLLQAAKVQSAKTVRPVLAGLLQFC